MKDKTEFDKWASSNAKITTKLDTHFCPAFSPFLQKVGVQSFLDAGSGELRVYGGAAVVANGNRKATIKSERMVRLDGAPASEKFDANAADALHEWAAQRSFDLFLSNLGNGGQVHWEPISLGWLRNFNYRMSFYSDEFRIQWMIDQRNQELAAEQQRAAWVPVEDRERAIALQEQIRQAATKAAEK